MARFNAIGRRVLPGVLILLVVVVVDVVVLLLLLLLSEVDSSLSVFVLANITSDAAFSLRPSPVCTSGCLAYLTGTWDLETLLHTDQAALPYLGMG